MTEQDNSLCLHIVGGGGERKFFPLDGGRMIVGRDADSDIVLSDPSISKRHATIVFDGRRTMIKDGVDGALSSNGVYVNNNKIDVPTRLAEGNVVKMGVFRFDVRRTRKVREAMPLQEVKSAEDLATFLASGEIHAVHDDDIHDLFRSFCLDPTQRKALFEQAQNRASEDNDVHRSSTLLRLRNESLRTMGKGSPFSGEGEDTHDGGRDILAISFILAIGVLLAVVIWGLFP